MGRREGNEEEGEGLRRGGGKRRKWRGGGEKEDPTPPPKLMLRPCLQQLASCLCEIWMQLLAYLETAGRAILCTWREETFA